jgi:HEAT repeat protein
MDKLRDLYVFIGLMLTPGSDHLLDRPGDVKLRQRGLWRTRLGFQSWRTPVFVPLGTVASLLFQKREHDNDPSILEVLLRTLPPKLQTHGEANSYFADQLHNGNCVVLFDGLDEVAKDDEFQGTVRALQGFITRYNKNQFLITSRNTSRAAGWRDGAGSEFRVFYVNELSEKQIDTFIDTWCAATGLNAVRGKLEDETDAEGRVRKRRSDEHAARLKAALRDNAPIRRLAKNPMLLSIVALVYRSPAQNLRWDRSALYEQCSTLLLEQWDTHRGVRVDDTGLTLKQKEAIMRRLAISLHVGDIGDEGGGREASRNDIEKVIAPVIRQQRLIDEEAAATEASRLLNQLIERSGLLVERQRGVLVFAHHTFQEYYSALALALDAPEKNRDFLLDPARLLADWWREVVLLYVGALPDASDFLERVGDATLDDLCQQRLRLAAGCLGEKPMIKQHQVRQDLVDRLLYVRSGRQRTIDADRFLDQLAEYLITWSKDAIWHQYAAFRNVTRTAQNEEQVLVSKTLQALDDRRTEFRMGALRAVYSFPDKPEYQPLWSKAIELFADPDMRVQRLAIRAVAEFSASADSAVPLIVKSTQSSNGGIREESVNSLVKLAGHLAAPKEAAQHLQSLFQNNGLGLYHTGKIFKAYLSALDDAQVVSFVRWMLQTAGADPDSARLYLQSWLRGQKSEVVLQVLMEQVESASGDQVRAAIAALGGVDADSPSQRVVVERLIRLFADPDDATRKVSWDALQRLADRGLRAVILAEITPLLNDADPRRRAGALRTFRSTPAADITSGVARQVLRACADAHPDVRSAAAEVLRAVDLPALIQEKIDVMIGLAQDAENAVRLAALEGIGALGESWSDARPSMVLLKALDDQSELIRIATAVAIAALGSKIATAKLIDKLLKSVTPPGLVQRLWRAPKVTPSREAAPLSWEIAASKRYDGSFEAAAVEAVVSLVKNDPPAHVIERLVSLARGKKNGPVRWYAFSAAAQLEKPEGAEARFDQLLRCVEQDPDLLGPWSGEQANEIIGPLLADSARNWHSAYYLRRSPNPLAVLWKHLPRDAQIRRIADTFGSQEVRIRMLGLELLVAGRETLEFDRMSGWIERGIADTENRVRGLALDTAEALLRQGSSPKILSVVSKCLIDNEDEIRESAWSLFEKRLLAA